MLPKYNLTLFSIKFPGRLLAALAAAGAVMGGCGKEQKIKPTVENLTESVYASAIVKPENEYKVYPNTPGVITDFFVQEGDTVQEGSPLFRIDNRNSELNKENAELEFDLAQKNLTGRGNKIEELKLAMETALKTAANDSINYERQKNLWEENIGSKTELDKARLMSETSKNNYLTAQKRYLQAKESLQNELQRARNRYKISKNSIEDYTVRSVIAGRVYELYKEKGETATGQEPVALLGHPSDFFLEMEIDEADVVQIKEGQPVILTLESYSGKTFEGKVKKVYPIMNSGTRTFTVTAKFVELPPVLYPNLTAEANIIVKQKKNAITIPVEYLVEGSYVLVDKDEKQKVTTGLVGIKKIEILSGIDTSRYIYKPETK